MADAPDHGLLLQRAMRIRSTPGRVLAAFFDPNDLAIWWETSHAVTVARPLAPYAVQWPPTSFTDEVLGKLGGTLHGTVMDVREGASFFLAEVYYTPPEGAPIGPMAIEVQVRHRSCAAQFDDAIGPRLRQKGGQVHSHLAQRCQVLALLSVQTFVDLLLQLCVEALLFAK